ncbi:hypothetical protein [Tenacibaculum maritimum]|uniref:hypothetical protein n=1 Tax=Tenacibaculum maritimum TaxID=107401 RepID=UPI0012E6D64C|nr:hypothetical protein [Tenacibaculum maritimum]CAA0151462.1 conserved hypothetical protein [Tenacibaculum maritimum]CAA0154951.1 conserved hypothetical protein [Tenacibaculum maritimum]CAA0155500.1 conserved hypothetical protein [Tenacibaculum maritimum]CAA0245159.1 conserved hypothetical protein [Tenacibaculum maritimum]
MGIISKSDLFYDDYSWTAIDGDDPKVTGKPDSTLLNRNEGYEIVYFINKFMEIHKLENKATAKKIELMIKDDLPSEIRSQEKIKTWIEKNW